MLKVSKDLDPPHMQKIFKLKDKPHHNLRYSSLTEFKIMFLLLWFLASYFLEMLITSIAVFVVCIVLFVCQL